MNPNHASLPRGLSAAEVSESRREHGTNGLSAQPRVGFFRRLLATLGDPITKILLAALVVNVLFLFRGEGWFETVGIALAILLTSIVATLSEYGSESAFLRLQEQASAATCRVRREGETAEIPIEQLVVGDTVLMGAGEAVPADGIVMSGSLSVDQAALTGESREQTKGPGVLPARVRRWDAASRVQLLRGSVVAGGEGLLRVYRVGDATLFGSMAASLQEAPRESPLKVRLHKLAGHISGFGYLAAVLVALATLMSTLVVANGFVPSAIWAQVSHFPTLAAALLHAATLAISVVIVAVPEGLPMMITVVLSRSMFRMLRDRVMVRKLTGIETAGSLTLLFTDKTGTLTKGRPEVSRLITGHGRYSPERLSLDAPAVARLAALSGRHNTAATMIREPGGSRPAGGNATDRALLAFAERLDSDDAAASAAKEGPEALDPTHHSGAPANPLGLWGDSRTDYLPFDSGRKYSAASVRSENGTLHLIKGAPELLLPRCDRQVGAQGAVIPLRSAAALTTAFEGAARRGERVLCLCLSDSFPADALPRRLIFLGLAVIRDGLRPSAAPTLKTLSAAGLQVVMITGDSRETATAIAQESGLLAGHEDAVLTSHELNGMTDHEVQLLLPRLRVVCRALPTDKSRLVRIAQQSGHVVGMTGDGINDAPALRLADVGFAMGSGTQVAKQAGDIIILDDNIASICKAVLYGRTIFKSIRKFLLFQLTMNLCAVGVSIIGSFLGFEAPVTVIQMLWINLIMDTLGGMAFAGEPPLAEYLREPPTARDAPVLTRAMAGRIARVGLYIVGLCVFFLKSPRIFELFGTEQSHMTGFFALFVFSGVAACFCARAEGGLLRGLGDNRSFVAIMAGVCAVQLAMIYLGGPLFRAYGLTLPQLGLVLMMAVTILIWDRMGQISVKKEKRKVAVKDIG